MDEPERSSDVRGKKTGKKLISQKGKTISEGEIGTGKTT